MTRSRHRLARTAPALALALGLALAGAPRAADAEAESVADRAAEIGAIAFDVTVLRPLNAAATVLGVAMFAASLPIVAPAGNGEQAWEAFVYYPFEYTVLRKLGEF